MEDLEPGASGVAVTVPVMAANRRGAGSAIIRHQLMVAAPALAIVGRIGNATPNHVQAPFMEDGVTGPNLGSAV